MSRRWPARAECFGFECYNEKKILLGIRVGTFYPLIVRVQSSNSLLNPFFYVRGGKKASVSPDGK